MFVNAEQPLSVVCDYIEIAMLSDAPYRIYSIYNVVSPTLILSSGSFNKP